MRYIIMLLLCIYISDQIKAQTLDTAPWCPPGATWVYRLYNAPDFLTVVFEKDTIISGKNAKKLKLTLMDYYSVFPPLGRTEDHFSYEYEYNSNDSIFFYDKTIDTFYLKYNFEGIVGDFLEVNKHATNCSDEAFQSNFTTSIISTGLDTLNNLIFPSIIYDDNYNNSAYLVGKVLKNIGSLDYFYPTINQYLCPNINPEYFNGLIYYSDSLRGTVINKNYPIQHILPIEQIQINNNVNKNYKLTLFPNPASTEINISDNNYNLSKFIIYNISGQIITEGKIIFNKIDLSNLNNGIYFITFYAEDGKNYFSKFLIIK